MAKMAIVHIYDDETGTPVESEIDKFSRVTLPYSVIEKAIDLQKQAIEMERVRNG